MSGFVQDLERLRSFAYHTSGQINFDSIRRDGQIRSTHNLLSGTPYDYLLATRRKVAQVVQLAGGPVEIRHHLPLRPGSMAHEPGSTLDSYVQLLNARAFFWVGTDAAPVRTGRGHFDYCRSQGDVFVIRTSLSALIGLNPKERLHVTRCNSVLLGITAASQFLVAPEYLRHRKRRTFPQVRRSRSRSCNWHIYPGLQSSRHLSRAHGAHCGRPPNTACSRRRWRTPARRG